MSWLGETEASLHWWSLSWSRQQAGLLGTAAEWALLGDWPESTPTGLGQSPRGPTVCLHGCCSLHQVVGELHGVGRPKRELSGQPDDKDAHQCILQDGDLRAQTQEEAAAHEEVGLGGAAPGPQVTPCTKCHRPEQEGHPFSRRAGS